MAARPGRPTPSPTTAPAPAPMNISAKVPMNSASSFGAIRLDIVDSRVRLTARRDQVCAGNDPLALGWPTVRGARRQAKRATLLRGDRLWFEIDAHRLRDAGAVFGI